MLGDAKERTLKVPKTKSPLMEFIEVIYFPHWIQFRMDLVCNRKPRLTLGIPYVHTVHASVGSVLGDRTPIALIHIVGLIYQTN
jgi:hypothetical protein